MEACRIGIVLRAPGVVDVGAPMKHKPLCYEILADARKVIEASPDSAFHPGIKQIGIVMDMTGRVDVAAPLPPRQLAVRMLSDAKDVIERYNEESAPEMRPFAQAVMGEG